MLTLKTLTIALVCGTAQAGYSISSMLCTPVRPMAWLALGVYLSSCYCLGMAIHAEIDDDAKDQQKTREGKDQ